MSRPTAEEESVLTAALRASQTLEIDPFVASCLEPIAEMLAASAVHAYVRPAPGADLELHSSWPERRREAGAPVPALSGPVAQTARRRAPEAEGPSERAGRAPQASDPADTIVLTLAEGDELLGAFVAVRGARRLDAGAEGTARARAFARLVTPGLRNALLFRELRETAVRDDIADCYNRRHFEAFLAEEIARAQRFRTRVAMLFLDMDDLKAVNSAHGHAMGSRVLQEVVGKLAAGIRKFDKLFRFGGDEFCVVLPETDRQGAVRVAERLRRAIGDSIFLARDVGGVRMSASLGVAVFPEHGESAEALVVAADRAMQGVKKTGKNSIAVAGSRTARRAPPRRRVRKARERA